jgi:hypothetical protein
MCGYCGGALFPGDVQRAWNYFGANTLQRLLAFVGSSTSPGVSEYGIFAASAIHYQRVLVAAQYCLSGHMLRGRIQVQKHFRFL